MQKIVLSTNSSRHLGVGSDGLRLGRFPDGEVSVVLDQNVENKDVYLIGSTEPPAENLLELIFSIDTVVRNRAKSLTIIIPYFGYAKSDVEKIKGQVLAARTVVRLIEAVGGKNLKVVTLNLHSPEVEGFFGVPHLNLSLMEVLARKFKNNNDLVVVSPDEGGVGRAREFAGILGNLDVVIIKKKRISDSKVKILSMIGEVDGRDTVIVDDMVQTGGTIISAARTLRDKGAKSVSLAVTHMVYSAKGYLLLEKEAGIQRIVTTNTIRQAEDISSKFEIIDVAPILKTILI
jgi:ribose-phosphate pyrophosphokinase